MVNFTAPMPNLVKAFLAGRKVRIVALGSSSTAGSGASTPHASYPSQLDEELDKRFPDWDFKVANLGVGGQLATHMLDRIGRDVLPQKPALVIWQTGVNDALSGVGMEPFRQTLKAGIERLQAHGIDVVLVNHQFYPKAERVSGYMDYVQVMREVAEENELPLFRRFAIMKHFIKSGQFTTDQLLSSDFFHMNDLSYGCLATLLADAIEDQVTPFIRRREIATTPRR